MLLRSPVLVLAMLSAAGCGGATASTSTGTVVPATTAGSSTAAVAPSAAAGTPVTGDPVKAPCSLKAAELAATHPAAPNEPILVWCPSACPDPLVVFGTDLYTDDSTVCRALVHAGAIPASGGKGAITFVSGQLTYVGSSRNGVDSNGFGTWPRSFYAQAVDDQNHPKGAAPTVYDAHTALVSCGAGTPFQGKPGDRFTAICTSDCTTGTVYGSNPYTDDSSLCTAAHHAGLLGPGALKFSVTISGPQGSFKGSTANGVTTLPFGQYGGSITVAKAQ